MASEPPHVTPEQLAQEHSIRFALLADLGVLALAVSVGLLGGSLTLKAEAIRFALGMSIEIFAYTVMWRLHRGKLHDLEFGGGKLEQIANLVTGLGMLGAAAWIAPKAMAIVGGVSIALTASTASPKAAPGARLKLSDTAGNCARCEIASGAVVRVSVATADSGTWAPGAPAAPAAPGR